VRGGSWNNNQNNARCAARNRNNPNNSNNNIGFRLVSHDPHVPPAMLRVGLSVKTANAWPRLFERRRGLCPAGGQSTPTAKTSGWVGGGLRANIEEPCSLQ